jgi:hypothetical protein
MPTSFDAGKSAEAVDRELEASEGASSAASPKLRPTIME